MQELFNENSAEFVLRRLLRYESLTFEENVKKCMAVG